MAIASLAPVGIMRVVEQQAPPHRCLDVPVAARDAGQLQIGMEAERHRDGDVGRWPQRRARCAASRRALDVERQRVRERKGGEQRRVGAEIEHRGEAGARVVGGAIARRASRG